MTTFAATPHSRSGPLERRPVGGSEALIDIGTAGIRRSGIHRAHAGRSGTSPIAPGHEIAGTVAEIGLTVTRFTPR
ncbi:alcohol dehydrogenase catalytic domain-containing protein [Streptosporangium sp. NPDC023825]|uniref:alcohol dehydrogenase catalytic domain-containing protein n=1 Tax=Streptosporangium sp. NPDC023825 TaxID=3154909 RepID=UPI00344A765E